jgi:hypothetical protein
VAVVGRFSDTIRFHPGPPTGVLFGECSFFVLKLTSAGDFVWARGTEGAGCAFQGDIGLNQEILSVTLTSAGDVWSVGTFQWFMDFDPGSGSFVLDTGDPFVQQGYLWQLDSAGSFVRALAFEAVSSNGDVRPRQLTRDASDRVYAAGTFSGTVDLDPGSEQALITAIGAQDAFVVKLAPPGDLLWVGAAQGPSSTTISGLAVDAPRIWASGVFTGVVDFDPGHGIWNAQAVDGSDAFVLSWSPEDPAPPDPVPALGGWGAWLGPLAVLALGPVLLRLRRRHA